MKPTVALLAAVLLANAMFVSGPARAGWGPTPVVVNPSTSISLLDSAPDGASGAYLLWQESGAGALRLQHLLASGDVDPTWPAEGAFACSVGADRGSIALLPDGLGSFIAWWTEAASLFVRRMSANGAGDPAWPARGKLLTSAAHDPRVITDGAGGLFAAWIQTGVRLVHIGPDGGWAAGWPANPRVVPVPPLYPLRQSIALAGDGGVYVTWTAVSLDTLQAPAGNYVLKIRSNSTNDPAWPVQGVFLPSRVEQNYESYDKLLVAAAPDGAGGVFAFTTELDPDSQRGWRYRLRRLHPNGSFVSGWGPEGAGEVGEFGSLPTYAYAPVVMATPDGGALLALAALDYTDSPFYTDVFRFDSSGGFASAWTIGVGADFDFALDPAGGYHAVAVHPSQYPGGLGHAIPHFRAVSAPALNSATSHELSMNGPDRLYAKHFKPASITPAGGGKAIVSWVGRYDWTGLVAALLGGPPIVTAVEAAAAPAPMLAARFVPGMGVRASLRPGSGGRLELFDLAGRLLSRGLLDASATTLDLSGTGALPSGLYLLRLSAQTGNASVKVVVTR